MTKTINQTFEEYLNKQKERLAPRTYKHYEYAISFLEDCFNGYGYNDLEPEQAKYFDENHGDENEFCDMFGPEVLTDSHFSEFTGYFLPKKIGGGKDSAKKMCAAAIDFYKYLIEKKYTKLEEDELLNEAIAHLRSTFEEGWSEYNNFNDNDYF